MSNIQNNSAILSKNNAPMLHQHFCSSSASKVESRVIEPDGLAQECASNTNKRPRSPSPSMPIFPNKRNSALMLPNSNTSDIGTHQIFLSKVKKYLRDENLRGMAIKVLIQAGKDWGLRRYEVI